MQSTSDILARVSVEGAEPTWVELKSAAGGCPASVRETMSAFANGAGGVLILGADDSGKVVDIDAKRVREALAQRAADDMEPAIRGDIEIQLVDGRPVVRFDVPALPPEQKPCYVKARGMYNGSYIRGADGDRLLTSYEIDRLLENRRQPSFDREVVAEASLADLDHELLTGYVRRITQQRPRAFEGLDMGGILGRLGIQGGDTDTPHPTLAGLLTFGRYPQQYFPQLFISVVALPTPIMGDPGPAGERFLDNQTCEGPIPVMVDEAVAAVRRNMTRAAVVQGVGRTDRYEYPLEVVRELIVNAVMHRDYSPTGRAAQIQVELYPDRLVVRSPGGFYGGVDVERLGSPDVSSSRNLLLAKILADTPLTDGRTLIAENRGSGIPTVMRTLSRVGQAPAEFDSQPRRVQVTVPHHALLTPDVLAWLDGLGVPRLTSAQRQALAVMRTGREVRNATLQGWGVHSADATRQLSELVGLGLATKLGDRRGATYVLSHQAVPSPQADLLALDDPDRIPALSTLEREILDLLSSTSESSTPEIAQQLHRSYRPTLNAINQLIRDGLVEGIGATRSPQRRYRASAAGRLVAARDTPEENR